LEIYLIRHTRVAVEPGVCYGQTDVSLSGDSYIDIESVKNRLDNVLNAIYISSPSQRCSLLARSLTTSQVIFDKRLMELDFGDWELKEWSSLNQDQLNKWMNDFVYECCPNGESYHRMFERVIQCYGELLEQNIQNLVIITHSGVIRSILSHVLSIPLKKSFALKIDYGSISKITIKEQIMNVDYINR
jgi:alpha-ribazole phosphatase